MKHSFHPEAAEEFVEVAGYYAERDPAIASRFVDAVQDAIGRIVESPNRWRVVEGDIRRCLTHVFPYAVLYTVEGGRVLILAVMHCSRRPGYWRSRTRRS